MKDNAEEATDNTKEKIGEEKDAEERGKVIVEKKTAKSEEKSAEVGNDAPTKIKLDIEHEKRTTRPGDLLEAVGESVMDIAATTRDVALGEANVVTGKGARGSNN